MASIAELRSIYSLFKCDYKKDKETDFLEETRSVFLIVEPLRSAEDWDKRTKWLSQGVKPFVLAFLRHLLSEKSPQEIAALKNASPSLNLSPDLQKHLEIVFEESEAFSARANEYGYKGAYLEKLKEKTAPFILIGNSELSAFLHKETQGKIEELWKKFTEIQGEHKGFLIEEAKSVLKEIQSLIKETFRKTLYDIKLPPELDKDGILLTCRSSSREDRSDLVNAGGNETITHIKPTKEAISAAIGDVLASYFDPHSLEQRLAQNDRITNMPLLAVILQKVIGELPGDARKKEEIPVAGVINVPASGTAGHVVICSLWGHGHQVVGGKSADKFIVFHDGKIVSLVVRKDNRLVPSTKVRRIIFLFFPTDRKSVV